MSAFVLFLIGVLIGTLVLIVSRIVVGTKSLEAHFLVVMVIAAMAYISWQLGDLLPGTTKSICSGVWVPIAVVVLIRFGSAMLMPRANRPAR